MVRVFPKYSVGNLNLMWWYFYFSRPYPIRPCLYHATTTPFHSTPLHLTSSYPSHPFLPHKILTCLHHFPSNIWQIDHIHHGKAGCFGHNIPQLHGVDHMFMGKIKHPGRDLGLFNRAAIWNRLKCRCPKGVLVRPHKVNYLFTGELWIIKTCL